jgi:hypothetical protein
MAPTARIASRILSLTAGALVVVAAPGHAQIGSGWSSVSISKSLQKTGDVYYSNSSGVETFRLNTSTASRCEIKINNSWTSGSHQFEGQVRVTGTPRSSGNSIQQILESTTGQGDASQVRWYSASNGTFKAQPTGITMGTNMYGVYQRINCIHYRSTGKIELWLNGSKKSTHNDFGSGSYYFKYGIYIAGSTGKPTASWRSIRVWQK